MYNVITSQSSLFKLKNVLEIFSFNSIFHYVLFDIFKFEIFLFLKL